MSNGLPSFVKEDNNKLIFIGKNKEMVAYIPEKYFDRKLVEQNGETFDIIGIFNYTVQDLTTGKNIGLHPFKFPTMFTTKPYTTEKVKEIKLIKESTPEDYRIFRYREGDEIAVSTLVPEFVGNVEKFLNLFYSLGYINNTIGYDEILGYITDNMKLNGSTYEVNTQVIGYTISELCRDKDDPNVPYRLSKRTNPHEYKSMALRNISKHVSPYTAIISEDFDESVLYAMMNNTPKDTPLEKILAGIE